MRATRQANSKGFDPCIINGASSAASDEANHAPPRMRNLAGFSSTRARITAISCFAAFQQAAIMKTHEIDCAQRGTKPLGQSCMPVQRDRGGETRRRAVATTSAGGIEAMDVVCQRTLLRCGQTCTTLVNLISPQVVHHDLAAGNSRGFWRDRGPPTSSSTSRPHRHSLRRASGASDRLNNGLV